ncbi:MAG TPA: LysM domain-containing protein [Burkholderiales bacterium]|nr:LysM domain-containing protein [Burkholderiales bacterium]
MQKSITALLAFSLAGTAWFALAQGDLQVKDTAPDRYVVQKGDTLWSIATKFLSDQWRWPEVWRMNQEQIRNPHQISPGDVLVLDRKASPPQLRLGDSSGSSGDGGGGGARAPEGEDSVKLLPRVYTSNLGAGPIPAIPPRAIEPFLTQPLLIEEGGLDRAPRIIATQEDRVNLGAGNLAYVSGFGKATDEVWQVYRAGQPLVDPDSQLTLGYEAVFLGTARVTRPGEPATVQIVNSKKEISAGDRLIPSPPATIPQYVPHAPASKVNGRIIAFYDLLPTSSGGRDSIVSINRGTRHGLEPGNVLAMHRNVVIYDQADYLKSRDRSPAIQLPPERYGLVYIFRTFASVSYALVMESTRPVQSGDIVQNP